MPAGRPSIYSKELVEAAWEYVHGGWQAAGDAVPSVAGLACEIGIHRDTAHQWADDESKEFSDILKVLAQKQERQLLNSGLDGTFKEGITKMMLSKHGYADKVETENFTINISGDDAKL